jgi:hypothetical protein
MFRSSFIESLPELWVIVGRSLKVRGKYSAMKKSDTLSNRDIMQNEQKAAQGFNSGRLPRYVQV